MLPLRTIRYPQRPYHPLRNSLLGCDQPIGSCDQHPELARVGGDVVDPNAADDLPALRGDRDLASPDEPGELGRRGPRGPVAPQPAFRRHVDRVDELRDLRDKPVVVGGRRLEQTDGGVDQRDSGISRQTSTMFREPGRGVSVCRGAR